VGGEHHRLPGLDAEEVECVGVLSDALSAVVSFSRSGYFRAM
jgi:hypothetical protein